jgi:hypothetical protein
VALDRTVPVLAAGCFLEEVEAETLPVGSSGMISPVQAVRLLLMLPTWGGWDFEGFGRCYSR